ncbi:hypothetical protein [Phocaeicola dorei]|uniref:hypothetical protein n=1 Tax=Phocaeicola dorei TaxID=357276 RepID=UPI0032EC1B24
MNSEVSKIYYNIYINKWFRETTSELDVLKISIDQIVDKVEIRFRNVSDSVVYWALDDLEYYKLFEKGRLRKLQNDIDVTSLMYQVEVNECSKIPFYLRCMDSTGMYLVRIKMKVSDYIKYYIDVYLERIEE